MEILYIIIAFLFVFTVAFLIIKYFLFPLFFYPKLNLTEAIKFLEEKNLKFINRRELNKEEKKINPFEHKKRISFKNLYSTRAEYIIVGFCISKKKYRFFWVELTKWYAFYMKFIFEIITNEEIGKSKNIKYKEVKDRDILIKLNKVYDNQIVLINDKCPACNSEINKKTDTCHNCGLYLR